MKWWHYILIGVSIPVLAWGSFRIGYKKGCSEPIIPQTDTITIVREKVSYKPNEVATITFSAIPIPQVVFRNDTVVRFVTDTVMMELPISHKVYKGEDYEVGVSGVFPQLDYCKTFSKERIVTQRVEVPVRQSLHLGVQVGVGAQYGMIARRFDVGPYVGLGLSFSF